MKFEPFMMVRCLLTSSLLVGAMVMPDSPVLAQTVSREQNIVDLRLGQRVMVDDGTCPAGQIKQVLGAKMTPSGVLSTRSCVPRFGPKTK